MGRRTGCITFTRPGYKLVMAHTEVRKDNGDLEVPPRLLRRVSPGVWEPVDWSDLPDNGAIRGLLKAMKAYRDEHVPRFRSPVIPHDLFFDVWPL